MAPWHHGRYFALCFDRDFLASPPSRRDLWRMLLSLVGRGRPWTPWRDQRKRWFFSRKTSKPWEFHQENADQNLWWFHLNMCRDMQKHREHHGVSTHHAGNLGRFGNSNIRCEATLGVSPVKVMFYHVICIYIYISLSVYTYIYIYICIYTYTHTVGERYIYILYTHRYPLLITSEARHSSCQEPPNRSNTWSSHETLCHQGHHLGHRSGNVTFAHDIFDSSTSLSILEWGNVNFTRCIFFLKPDSPTQFYLK